MADLQWFQLSRAIARRLLNWGHAFCVQDPWMTSPKARLPRSIWTLGFVSLLMDASSEMIHALLPMFLVSVLGASALAVGLIEGVAEATAQIVKIFSGAVSDAFGKRKPLVL